jgi:hypothetical protein
MMRESTTGALLGTVPDAGNEAKYEPFFFRFFFLVRLPIVTA